MVEGCPAVSSDVYINMFKYPKYKSAELVRFSDPLPPAGGSGSLTRAINFFQGGTSEEEETSGKTTQHIRHSRWGGKDIKRTEEIKKMSS